MRLLFEEYGRAIIATVTCSIILSIFLFFLFVVIYPNSVEAIELNVNDIKTVDDKIPVSIGEFIVNDAVIKQGDSFDYQKRIYATNTKGEDISTYVSLMNVVDTSSAGEKQANYILRYNGQTMIGNTRVIVEGFDNEEYD